MTDLKKKLLWQCRRGLWELDIILKPFVERSFDQLHDHDQILFQEFLKLEDIELFDILVNKVNPSQAKYFDLVGLILDKHMAGMTKG